MDFTWIEKNEHNWFLYGLFYPSKIKHTQMPVTNVVVMLIVHAKVDNRENVFIFFQHCSNEFLKIVNDQKETNDLSTAYITVLSLWDATIVLSFFLDFFVSASIKSNDLWYVSVVSSYVSLIGLG